MVIAACSVWALTGVAPGNAAAYPTPVKGGPGIHFKMDDPGAVRYNGSFYVFKTGKGLQETWSSQAGGGWSLTSDGSAHQVLTGSIPGWVHQQFSIWAPDIVKISSSRFVVYFAAAATSDGRTRCIGTAVSSNPKGPFTMDPNPLVCSVAALHPQDAMSADPGNRATAVGVGVIDPSPAFVTIGGKRQLYLLYKTQGTPSTIRMVQLSMANGTTALGNSRQLLYSAHVTIQAPTLVQHGQYFILFVAHGPWNRCSYSTWWFKSTDIWSWDNAGGTVLLNTSTTGGLCGPGAGDVIPSQATQQHLIFFNGWTIINSSGVITSTPATNSEIPLHGARPLYVAVLTFASNGYTPIIGQYLGQGQ